MPRASVDKCDIGDQYTGMKFTWTLAALIALAGCSGDPKALGITGPGVQPVEPAQGLLPTDNGTGAPQAGTFYGPTVGPTRGPSGFWGYN